MNNREQKIRNGAVALAILLAFVIIAILGGMIYTISSLLPGSASDTQSTGSTLCQIYDEIPSELVIDNSMGELRIEAGDAFKVSGADLLNNFSCDYNNGKMVIGNSSKGISLSAGVNPVLTVTIPSGTSLKLLDISAGAGSCDIRDITTDRFEFETGAGNAVISNLSADYTNISQGAGKLTFTDSALGNLNLECGVGTAYISGRVYGICKIECGIGSVTLDLEGSLDDYEITTSAGIGAISINGKKYNNVNGKNKGADNSITISGGIGEITVTIN